MINRTILIAFTLLTIGAIQNLANNPVRHCHKYNKTVTGTQFYRYVCPDGTVKYQQ